MAFHLQDLAGRVPGDAPILVVCGLRHVRGLARELERPQAQPFEKPPHAKLYHLSSASLGEVMGCFPFLTAVYELGRSGTPADTSEPVQAISVPAPGQFAASSTGKEAAEP